MPPRLAERPAMFVGSAPPAKVFMVYVWAIAEQAAAAARTPVIRKCIERSSPIIAASVLSDIAVINSTNLLPSTGKLVENRVGAVTQSGCIAITDLRVR